MRHVKLAAAGGTLAAAAAVVACFAPAAAQAATPGAAQAGTVNPNAIIGKSVDQSWTQLNAFWTPARLAAAKEAAAPASSLALPAGVTIPAGTQESAPATSPTGAGASVVSPDSLPGKTSRVWTNHKSLPATAIGRLYFQTATGPSACTATIVNSPNKDTIWTAAHCVSDGHGHEYQDFVFKPNQNGSSVPFGSFKAKYISAPAGYVDQGIFQYDYAAIALTPNTHGAAQNLAGAEGWIMGGNTYNWPALNIFGYPQKIYPSGQPVDDTRLRYCTGSTKKVTFMEQFQCDMGQGSSGGPLLYKLTAKEGWVVGDVSWGDEKGTVNSPQLSATALATLKLAYKK